MQMNKISTNNRNDEKLRLWLHNSSQCSYSLFGAGDNIPYTTFVYMYTFNERKQIRIRDNIHCDTTQNKRFANRNVLVYFLCIAYFIRP